MRQNNSIAKKKVTLTAAFVFLAIVTVYAMISELWLLIAIPVGFLFGFFLQKGDLCGSSAFSEVLIMKDRSKIFGLWIAIVVSMVGILIMDIFGLVILNPKPLIWINYIAGGIIFGVGMVLAGGCVSGCLYKTGTGNINSMAGLIGIPIGIALVEHGPLNKIFVAMKKNVIVNSSGGPVSLPSLTGLPYWLLVLLILAITFVWIYLRKNKNKPDVDIQTEKNFSAFLLKAWKPWQAGIAIGLLVIPAYLSSASIGRNYPLGVTHGVLHIQLLATENNINHVWQKPSIVKVSDQSQTSANQPVTQKKPAGKKVSWWLILLISSLVAGSRVSAGLSDKAKLLPKPPEQIVIAFFGGILIGTGAAIATGCVIGNILSGWAMMSVGTILFGIVALLTNWVTTYFYLIGGSFLNKK